MPFIPTTKYLDHIFASEQSFCQVYPLSIQQLDSLHCSPLIVAYKAVKFLANKKETKILDIGSGTGKFCLAGAYYKPNTLFYGVEQRQWLVNEAISASQKLGRLQVGFIHKNFTQLNLKEFDGFYFYNSFSENLPEGNKIDDAIAYCPELYHYYTKYLQKQLEMMPEGTRIATYCSSYDDEIPSPYRMVETDFDNRLKFWVKT